MSCSVHTATGCMLPSIWILGHQQRKKMAKNQLVVAVVGVCMCIETALQLKVHMGFQVPKF